MGNDSEKNYYRNQSQKGDGYAKNMLSFLRSSKSTIRKSKGLRWLLIMILAAIAWYFLQ